MPWFIDGKNCIIKGTKESPGEVVKCHSSPELAVAHLKALYANMPEREKESTSEVINFKEGDENRCLIVCTVDEKDQDGEEFSTEAMDWAFAHAKESEMPQLRGIHIKGIHIGDVLNVWRAGKYGIAEARYFDTPIAKEFSRAVKRGDIRGASLGFIPVEVTGNCPHCGSRLLAGRQSLRVGMMCPTCSNIYSGRRLKSVRFKKAEIFDVSLTDRPSVRNTRVFNYHVSKENKNMERKVIKERLLALNFDQEVVEAFVGGLSDEDCERMKEAEIEPAFKDAVAEAAKIVPPAAKTSTGIVDLDQVLAVIKEEIGKVMPKEVEIELPAIDAKLKELEDKVDGITGLLKELIQSDEERLKEMAQAVSPATAARLLFRQNTEPRPVTKETLAQSDGTRVLGADGQVFETVTAHLLGGN